LRRLRGGKGPVSDVPWHMSFLGRASLVSVENGHETGGFVAAVLLMFIYWDWGGGVKKKGPEKKRPDFGDWSIVVKAVEKGSLDIGDPRGRSV